MSARWHRGADSRSRRFYGAYKAREGMKKPRRPEWDDGARRLQVTLR